MYMFAYKRVCVRERG